MKGKNSIALLRSSLQMTGETFGKLLAVGQPMVSKWEKDISNLSTEKREEISRVFDVPIYAFVNDVDPITESIITKAALNYRNRSNRNYNENASDEYSWNDDVDEIQNRIQLIYDKKPEAVRLIIAAAEKYAYGHYKGRTLDGKSDYSTGRIDRKDPCLNIICMALEAALGKIEK